MPFENYNNHPKGLTTNDCVVRAISKAFDRECLMKKISEAMKKMANLQEIIIM